MKIKNYIPQILNNTIPFRIETLFYYFLILLLPTQLGKHFWPDFSYVLGIRVDYLSPTVYLTDLLVGIVFILWLINILKLKLDQKSKIKNQKSKIQFKIQKFHLILIFTFLYLIFNILISGRIFGGLYSLLKLLEMSFLAYYTAKSTPYQDGKGFIDGKKHFQKIMLLFSASVILESLLAIGQFLKQGSIGGILYFLGERTFTGSTPGIANASLNGELVLRPYATFPHPNVMAGFLLVSMILVLGFLLNSKRHCEALKWLWQSLLTGRFKKDCFASLAMTAALILGTIALFLSMSRIAILLWVVIICYYFIKKIIYSSSKRSASRSSVIPAKAGIHGPRIKSGMTRFVGVPFCIVAIAVFIFSPLGLRFTKIANTDEAVVQREVLISSSIKMIESSPLFGVGLGNFIPVLSKIQKPLSLGLYLQPVHNIFLLVASEMGIVGLMFFLWFLWKTFRQLFTRHCEAMKRPRQSLKIWDCFASLAMTSEGVLLVAFSAILILGLFDHYWLTLQQGQLLFGFILGMCWAKIDKA